MELITKSFAQQCISFPARVDAMLAKVESVDEAKDMLDKASAMKHYAEKLKAGIEIERPIAVGVLKIKAKIGELCPAKTREKAGAMKGKKGATADVVPFPQTTIAAYRKLADHKDKIDEFADACEEVPTQGEFLKFVQAPHVTKNTGENEWYTPEKYIESARQVMGAIDLDPASCEDANATVKAKKFYCMADDGLSKRWKGNVWLNPPYSKDLCRRFIDKLIEERKEGRVSQAIVLVNNATETAWGQALLAASAAVCFPSARIQFISKYGKLGNCPLQGQMVCYLGDKPDGFIDVFSDLGGCLHSQAASGRLGAIRRLVNALKPHERAVVMDWLKEPTDGR